VLLTRRHSGPLFKKKYLNALVQSKVYEEELASLNQQIPNDVQDTWTTMIKEWERDRTKPNPYYTPLEGGQLPVPMHRLLTLILKFTGRAFRGRYSDTPRLGRGGGVQAVEGAYTGGRHPREVPPHCP